MSNEKTLAKVKTVIDPILKSTGDYFWYDGNLNIKAAWGSLGKVNYAGIPNIYAFDDYLKTNCRDLGLIGKLNLSGRRTDANKVAKGEMAIEDFKLSVVEDHDQALPEDWVVRTMHGTRRPVMYHGISKSAKNVLKTAYANVQGIGYFEVRPCLHKNWINWSDERQQASCMD
jgi:hypothetical protein